MAYTYLIGWSRLNIWYYGARWSGASDPSDLWVTYFTSSKAVKRFRKLHGEPDVVQVRRTFVSKEAAAIWENKVLRRLNAADRDDFLNLNVGCPKPFTNHPSGISAFRYGKKHTDESRQKMANARLGYSRSTESCVKQAETMSKTQIGGKNNNAKSIRVTKVDGSNEIFGSIADFERAYNLKSKTGYRIVGQKASIKSMPISVTKVEIM